MSLANKITWLYALSFLLFMIILFASLYLSVASALFSEVDEELNDDVIEFSRVLKQEGLTGLIAELKSDDSPEEAHQEFIRLFKLDGTIVYQSDLKDWQALKSLALAHFVTDYNEETQHFQTIAFDGHEFDTRIITALISDQLVLQIGEFMEAKADVLEILQTNLLVIFTLSAPLMLFVIYRLARKVSKNIKAISNAATSVSKGDFSTRVPENISEQETHQLAVNFNHMAEKIELLLREMREMTDNIAHDLRSPLGRIRAISEMTLTGEQNLNSYQQAAENTLNECDRLLGLINMTLDVAEAEAGIIRTDQTTVNLKNLIEDVCELYEPVAEKKSIAISSELEQAGEIKGNPASLQRMIANLLDNAIKYTPEHGKVTVTLTSHATGTCISVIDTGIGIPSHDQQRVFERFFRCDQSRTQAGSGLGLSYSRAVARAHGGDIKLSSKPNTHTAFSVLLPI